MSIEPYPYEDEYLPSGGNMDPECFGVPQSRHDDPNDPYYDPPCPKCGRREGAFEQGECTPCGYKEER